MPDETPATNPDQNSTQPPEGGDQTPPENPPATPKNKKVIPMPTSAIGAIRTEEREKGRKAAMSQADKDARDLGYASHADMVSKLKAQRTGNGTSTRNNGTTQRPSNAPRNGTSGTRSNDRALSRLQQQHEQLSEQLRRSNRARAGAEKRTKRMELQVSAIEAEAELRVLAVKHGVQDVDYAVHLLQKELQGKTEADLNKFDEDAFFAKTLRERKPALYTVQTTVADTAPEDKAPEPKPGQKPPTSDPNGDKSVDVKKMTQPEYEAHLRKRGLTPPNFGMPG